MLFFLLLSGSTAFAGRPDSLQAVARNTSLPDSSRFESWFKLEEIFRDDLPRAFSWMDEAEVHAKKVKDDKMLFQVLERKYYLYLRNNKFSEAFRLTQQMIELGESMKNNSIIAKSYSHRGNIFRNLNLLGKAADNEKEAVKYYMLTDNTHDKAYHTYLLGFYLFNNEQYKEALPNFQAAYDMHMAAKHDAGSLAESAGWIGNSYSGLKDYEKALSWRYKSLSYAMETKDNFTIAEAYRYMGNVYRKKGDFDGALVNYEKSFELFELSGNKGRSGLVLYFLAEQYAAKKEFKKAADKLNKVLEPANKFAEELLVKELGYKLAGTVYKEVGEPLKSVEYLQKYVALVDSSQRTQAADQLVEQQMKADFAREEQKMKAEQDAREVQVAQDKKSDALLRNIFLGGLIICFIAAIAVYRGYNAKKRSNRILRRQKSIIEEKNKEITDSINYAKHIQSSILPPEDLVYEYLKECFVLFKPKDIVSGDFYWVERSGDRVLFAAVDCTGHGVPGAMMSVLGNSALNTVVGKDASLTPDTILNHLNDAVQEVFSHKYLGSSIQDGMDMAICSLDRNKMKLRYAGARNPLCVVRGEELIELKGDKQAIAARQEEECKPFTGHEIEVKKGDCIYIFSDGYGDQFGGLKGKKFKYAQLKALFKNIALKPMYQQKQLLEKTLEEWRGNLEQVDDILVLGVRV